MGFFLILENDKHIHLKQTCDDESILETLRPTGFGSTFAKKLEWKFEATSSTVVVFFGEKTSWTFHLDEFKVGKEYFLDEKQYDAGYYISCLCCLLGCICFLMLICLFGFIIYALDAHVRNFNNNNTTNITCNLNAPMGPTGPSGIKSEYADWDAGPPGICIPDPPGTGSPGAPGEVGKSFKFKCDPTQTIPNGCIPNYELEKKVRGPPGKDGPLDRDGNTIVRRKTYLNKLVPGDIMRVGDTLCSSEKCVVLDETGLLRLKGTKKFIQEFSYIGKRGNTEFHFQKDGNVVLYDRYHKILRTVDSHKDFCTSLELKKDGLKLYCEDGPNKMFKFVS